MSALPSDVDKLSDDDIAGDSKIERRVDTLSDDDPEIVGAKFTRQQKRKSLEESRNLAKARERLRIVVTSKCNCKKTECRQQFRGKDEFEKLLALRMRLWSMDKAHADQEAGFFQRSHVSVFVCSSKLRNCSLQLEF